MCPGPGGRERRPTYRQGRGCRSAAQPRRCRRQRHAGRPAASPGRQRHHSADGPLGSGGRRPQPPARQLRHQQRRHGSVVGTAADNGKVQSLLRRAMTLLGTPYRWGGSNPDSGFDCSGLVGYVFRSALGIELPRVSREMAHDDNAELINDRTALAAGDLVFFGARAASTTSASMSATTASCTELRQGRPRGHPAQWLLGQQVHAGPPGRPLTRWRYGAA